MRLVAFENPIFATVQGEGILVGMPSVFIRLYGCSYSCSWCDTKDSWRPGSTWTNLETSAVLGLARAPRFPYAVITGGDPLQQADDTLDLVMGLKTEWVDRVQGNNWRGGMHVTVETQAAIYDERVATEVDLLSLSPKLHDWREEIVFEYLKNTSRNRMRSAQEVQLKVVVQPADVELGIKRLCDVYKVVFELKIEDRVHFILQPESSTGQKGVQAVRYGLEAWYGSSLAQYRYPRIRLLGQLHKGNGFPIVR